MQTEKAETDTNTLIAVHLQLRMSRKSNSRDKFLGFKLLRWVDTSRSHNQGLKCPGAHYPFSRDPEKYWGRSRSLIFSCFFIPYRSDVYRPYWFDRKEMKRCRQLMSLCVVSRLQSLSLSLSLGNIYTASFSFHLTLPSSGVADLAFSQSFSCLPSHSFLQTSFPPNYLLNGGFLCSPPEGTVTDGSLKVLSWIN